MCCCATIRIRIRSSRKAHVGTTMHTKMRTQTSISMATMEATRVATTMRMCTIAHVSMAGHVRMAGCGHICRIHMGCINEYTPIAGVYDGRR